MHTGLLMDIKRFAVHDGPGIRTTLFLKGCSLKCVWCHNPEGISGSPQLACYAHKCITCGECALACSVGAHRVDAQGHAFNRSACIGCGACAQVCLGDALRLFGRTVSVDEALALAMEDRDFYGLTGGLTLSGGEPLLQSEFAASLLCAAHENGIHTAVDTCGCVPWAAFEAVLPHADLFLYDIKHIDPVAHKRLTGRTNEQILGNLRRLSASGARIEIRMPLVPGCNDDEAMLHGVGAFLGGLKIERMRVLSYHSLARSKYAALGMPDTMPDVPSPDAHAVERAVSILRAHGVNALAGHE